MKGNHDGLAVLHGFFGRERGQMRKRDLAQRTCLKWILTGQEMTHSVMIIRMIFREQCVTMWIFGAVSGWMHVRHNSLHFECPSIWHNSMQNSNSWICFSGQIQLHLKFSCFVSMKLCGWWWINQRPVSSTAFCYRSFYCCCSHYGHLMRFDWLF